MRRGFSILALAVTGWLFAVAPASAQEQVWLLTTGNNLVDCMSNNPLAFSLRPITGMAPGEYAIGIDFRPAAPTGRMYALSNLGQLYLIANPGSGAAVAVGGGGIALSGTEFGFDFNPTVDRIRVISDARQNLRIHPDLGTLVATDSMLAFTAGDPNQAATPQATGAAYINNVAGAVSTVLYDIDSALDILVTQVPPNNGRLNTVGPLGVDVLSVNGFDVSGTTGIAYAAFNSGTPQSQLYTINLATGAASLVGWIGCNEVIRGLSINNGQPTPTETSTWGRIKNVYR